MGQDQEVMIGGRPVQIAKYEGQPILNGDAEDLKLIEVLYASDREEEALKVIDRVLGLPDDRNGKLERLKHLMTGKEHILQVYKPVGDPKNPTFEVYMKLGGAFTHQFMLLRCKCFSAIADRNRKLMDQALENSEIVLRLFPKDNDLLAIVAQVIFIKGDVDKAVKIVQEVLARDPKHQTATSTMRIFERGTQAESFRSMTDRAHAIVVLQLEKMVKKEPIDEGALHQAHDLLLKSLQIAENQPKAWASLAFLYSLASDREKTLNALKNAQKYNPSEELAQIVAQNCEKRGWFAEIPAAAPAAEAPATGNWATSGADAKRTGRSSVIVAPPLTLAWVLDQCGPINGGIVGSGFVAAFGGAAHKVFAVDVRSGRRLWEYALGLPVGTPAIDSGRIYAGSSDLAVCLDLQTGKEIWKYQRATPLNHALREGCVLASEGLVILSDDRTVILEAKDGKELTTIETHFDASYHAGACTDGTYAYIPGSRHILFLEMRTGKGSKTEFNMKLTSGPVLAGERLVFGTNQGSVGGISTKTKEGWVTEINEEMELITSRPAFSDGRIFAGSPDGNVCALRENNGDTIWKTKVGGFIFSGLLTSGSTLYALSDESLSALSADKGEILWRSDKTFSGGTSAPAILGNRLLVGGDKLYAFKGSAGKTVEEKTAAPALQASGKEQKKWWKPW